MVWPALIGAGASLAGGLLGMFGQRSANDRAEDLANQNIAQQREYATTALQWRAGDAMKAYAKTGLHPLALLGVQPSAFSPVSTSFGNEAGELGRGISNMGQDITRAIHAGADRRLREQALNMQQVQMNNAAERGALENELLRMQIMSQRMRLQQQMTPPLPTVRTSIPDTTRLHMGVNPQPTFENMPRVGVGHLTMPDGSLMPVKSKEAQDVLEDDLMGNFQHWLQRSMGPSFWQRDPGIAPKPGYRWTVNFWGNWVQVPKSTPREPRRGLSLSNSGYGSYRR